MRTVGAGGTGQSKGDKKKNNGSGGAVERRVVARRHPQELKFSREPNKHQREPRATLFSSSAQRGARKPAHRGKGGARGQEHESHEHKERKEHERENEARAHARA